MKKPRLMRHRVTSMEIMVGGLISQAKRQSSILEPSISARKIMMPMRKATLEAAPASSSHHLESLFHSESLAFRGFGTLS